MNMVEKKVKLSKREALRICHDLWEWLYRHPMRVKHEWPGWEELKKKYTVLEIEDCPMCAWVEQKYGREASCVSKEERRAAEKAKREERVDRCPMVSLWPYGCNHVGAPFSEWCMEHNKAKNAKIIYHAAEMLLHKEMRK